MATNNDISEILGIPKSKIESWSRARDSQYLLAQFLKSFSRFELKQRVQGILDDLNEMVISPQEFIDTFISRINESGIEEFSEANENNFELVLQPKGAFGNINVDMVVKMNGLYFAIEFKHLLPSQSNLERNAEQIKLHMEKNGWPLERIIYIMNNKKAPSTIIEAFQNRASFYRFDTIAEKLFGKKVIFKENKNKGTNVNE